MRFHGRKKGDGRKGKRIEGNAMFGNWDEKGRERNGLFFGARCLKWALFRNVMFENRDGLFFGCRLPLF